MLGGWLLVVDVVALFDGPLQISGVLVGASIILAITSLSVPSVPWLRRADHRGIETASAGVVGFVVTLWWRPCIGTDLGSILTGARDGVADQLPGISTYMLGSMLVTTLTRPPRPDRRTVAGILDRPSRLFRLCAN